MKNNIFYLKHIRESIEQIEDYLGDIDYKNFRKNQMLIDAVIRQMEIIGEATSKLDSIFKKKYSRIPFRDIISMRNFLIHEYFGVDTKTVWDTCKTDLKDLKKIINSIL